MANYVVSTATDAGLGSLRQALLDANGNLGIDAISFAIGGGSKSIELLSELPSITESVSIDATTQPGYAGKPLIEITGRLLSDGNGLTIQAGQCTVRGLAINQFPGIGIELSGPGQNTVESNYVGTDLTGLVAKGNFLGIQALNSGNNRIGGLGVGNVVSGNKTDGIRLDGFSTSNSIQGNRIGTDEAGLTSIPNQATGVSILASSINNIVGADGDDANNAGKGNVISGNLQFGIRIAANSNIVAGNLVGVNATGKAALANGEGGILLTDNASNNRIGSNADGVNDVLERNVISGNNKAGLRIFSSNSNQIAGNWIGVGVDGSGLQNAEYGIQIDAGSTANVIGANAINQGREAAKNVVSGNGGFGIYVFAGVGNLISSNYVGVSPNGRNTIANARDGIVLAGGSSLNEIGRFGGNVVSGNLRNGILIVGSNANTISKNTIGLSADGQRAIPNIESGVAISGGSQFNIVGTNNDSTTDDAERNIISGNRLQGVSIIGSQTDSNSVVGNFVGTDVTGMFSIPNQADGIVVSDQAAKNAIGGVASAQRNLISGNVGWGVSIQANSRDNSILGNWVGLASDGSDALGNTQGGISINQSIRNAIGNGTAAGSNLIAYNGKIGVRVIHPNSYGNSVSRNTITMHDVTQIDLGDDGPTLNDSGDLDVGPNELQNYPVVEFIATSQSSTQLVARMNSTPSKLFQVEFFSEEPGVLAHRFLGMFPVITDASGNVNLIQDLPFALPLNARVFATARDPLGNQSEYSPAKSVIRLLPLVASATQFREGDPDVLVTVSRPTGDTSFDLVVGLTNSAVTQVSLPTQVIIPAGQSSVQFAISIVDDLVPEPVQEIRVIATVLTGEPASQLLRFRLLDNDSNWHNYALPLDADGDGGITPLDVLLIINYLNSNADKNLVTASVPNPRIFIDIDDDLTASPLDVLLVINFLNKGASGEGEQDASALGPSSFGSSSIAIGWDSHANETLVDTRDEFSFKVHRRNSLSQHKKR